MTKTFPSERAVIITGAARGQGAAHAAHIGRPGVRVILTDVLEEEGERTAAVLRSSGLDAHFIRLDVSDEQNWQELANELATSKVPVRGLVNNAGLLRYSPLLQTPLADLELQEKVNIHGTFLGIKHIAPLLLQAGGGAIVNVASTAALAGSAGYSAYSATKAAIVAITKVAARELAPHIRVNSVCPGGVATAMNLDEPEGGSSSSAPLGRRASVDEISPLVRFLLSNRASFITGSNYTIDGGLTA